MTWLNNVDFIAASRTVFVSPNLTATLMNSHTLNISVAQRINCRSFRIEKWVIVGDPTIVMQPIDLTAIAV